MIFQWGKSNIQLKAVRKRFIGNTNTIYPCGSNLNLTNLNGIPRAFSFVTNAYK